jgi:hypothetical protein
MKRKVWFLVLGVAVLIALAVIVPCVAPAGEVPASYGYKVFPQFGRVISRYFRWLQPLRTIPGSF